MSLSTKIYTETKEFADYELAATYLKSMYDKTKTEGYVSGKITCKFGNKEAIYCFYHDLLKKHPLLSPTHINHLEKGTALIINQKKIYLGKLKSSTLNLQELKVLGDLMKSKNLFVNTVTSKAQVSSVQIIKTNGGGRLTFSNTITKRN